MNPYFAGTLKYHARDSRSVSFMPEESMVILYLAMEVPWAIAAARSIF